MRRWQYVIDAPSRNVISLKSTKCYQISSKELFSSIIVAIINGICFPNRRLKNYVYSFRGERSVREIWLVSKNTSMLDGEIETI